LAAPSAGWSRWTSAWHRTRPFLLYASDWDIDLAPLIGAPMVHQQLRRWMEGELGMTFEPQNDGAEG
jgi:hypothetical protein